MKTGLKFLMIVMSLFLMRCSDESIEPALLEEDQSTHMQAFPTSVFAIEVTTIAGGNMEDPNLPQLANFYLEGPGGTKLSINWGDGTIQKVTLTGETRDYFEHQYSRFKNYTIQVTGEISSITTFGLYYQHIIIRDVHLAGLVNLAKLSMGFNYQNPSVVNFSHNRKIEIIDLTGEVADIIIPSENNLSTVLISGPNNLTTVVIDRIISRVYTSVQSSPRAGYFALHAEWYQETNDKVGPPSAYSITKLKKLRDVYGWEIAPEIE